MKRKVLVVEIAALPERVFAFVVNPQNTPKWIPSIIEESVSDLSVKVGSVFSQKFLGENNLPTKNALVVTGFQLNKQLDFHEVNGSYACYYRLDAIPSGTRFTYIEEAGLGKNLEKPMKLSSLKKLKLLVEQEK